MEGIAKIDGHRCCGSGQRVGEANQKLLKLWDKGNIAFDRQESTTKHVSQIWKHRNH